MERYETKLYGAFDLDELSAEERAIYEEVKAFAETDPEWLDLENLWIEKIKETGVLGKREDCQFAHQQPLARIYSDISLRLRLKQQENREKEKEKGK